MADDTRADGHHGLRHHQRRCQYAGRRGRRGYRGTNTARCINQDGSYAYAD